MSKTPVKSTLEGVLSLTCAPVIQKVLLNRYQYKNILNPFSLIINTLQIILNYF